MATTENDRNERDLILAPNEYALVSDATKGSIDCYVGPFKTSLAGTDRCVLFDTKTKRFRPVPMAEGVQLFQTAPEGFYCTLKNAAEGDKHPTGSGKMSTPVLRIGKKVNISGPASFALWPGQMAKVLQGHNLRSNEYLLVRVYDEEAARANWHNAVIKTQEGADAAVDAKSNKKTQSLADAPKGSFDIPSEKDLTMGKLFVIKGTNVSFYMPSTGIEVVPEHVNGETRYVREAVTLELLEYCLLLDQDGTKRYVHGPAVVFPRPTEKFVEAPIKSNPDKAKAKKFRAQELTAASGIHIRVIADYTEDDGTQRKAGDELFVTGKQQTIYFPRKEHAVIKYGEQDVHFGIAIPLGESRYVLNRLTGAIRTEFGPQVFLPDPRHEVIVNRALPLKLCELMYPGNGEALEINAARLGVDDQDIMSAAGGSEVMLNNAIYNADSATYSAASAVATPDTTRKIMIKGASKSLPGDAFDRKTKFTAPRSIVLNTKYDGAVTATLWTGFAALLVRKNGDRRVVQGPGTFTLEYDEAPQVLTLSTGKPKTTDKMFQTVYLLTTANKVSDVIEVETKDFCKLNIKVSYRVSFEGDPNRWFNVDNYVKFLCDHERSRLRAAVQKVGIEELYGNHTDFVRDVVLGKATASEDASGGKAKAKSTREGAFFEENGMRIYDVEVLAISMQNAEVEKMLVAAQRDVIQNALVLQSERRKLSYVKEAEDIKRQTALAQAETQHANMELQKENVKHKLEVDLAALEANSTVQSVQITKELETERARDEIAAVARARNVADREVQVTFDEKAQALKLKELAAQVKAVVEKGQAITPDLIAALSAFGERAMVEKVAEAMAPLGILSGGKKSVVEILQEMLKGTALASQLGTVLNTTEKANGTTGKGRGASA